MINQPIKVLFVGSGKAAGGVSPIIRNQGESLREHGIEVSYYAIYQKGIKGYLKSAAELRKILKQNHVDIIHAHYGWCGIVAFLARRHEKIVTSFMGDDIVGSNNEDGSVTFKSKLLAAVNIFLGKYIYARSIVKSEEMWSKSGKRNFVLIPNGVNIKKFSARNKTEARQKLGIPSDEKFLIFVSDPGRVEKNYALAEAATSLLSSEKIRLFPVFNRSIDELVDYYSAADVMVMTSFHEGSPNVIKESLACGIPAVATPVGDIQWVFGNEPGYFISNFQPEELSIRLKEAFEFAAINERTKGKDRILALGLDSDSIARKIIQIYSEVLH